MTDFSKLARKITWVLFANQSLASAGFIAAATINSILGAQLGGSDYWTGVPSAVYLVGGAFAASLWGIIMDRIGRRKPVMVAGALGYCLCWLPLLLGMPMGSVFSYSLFFAMGLCAPSFTLSWSCAKEVNPPALSGMATSVVNVGGFLGTAIMQPLVGWAIDHAHAGSVDTSLGLGDYQAGIAILTGFALMGLIATLFVRETYCRYVTSGEID